QGDDVLVRGQGLAGREIVRELTPLLGEGILVRPNRIDASQAVVLQPPFLELTDERRARLVAFVTDDTEMPQATKDRVLAQLAAPSVPRQVVDSLEQRMGG
ncbi:MAG: efflux transporter periplasmic adaptor subunit, partial [Roseobacter sp.]|nr:efflux transporter periplasmic adaptor subunit [Roseobacter sp.]